MRYGLGFADTANSSIASFYYQSSLYKNLTSQIDCGGWFDITRLSKGKSSLYCSHSLGLKLTTNSFYAESLHGMGFISNPDALLGGRFQFFHDIGFGMHNRDGFSLGLGVKHVSSAGIHSPNIGRNYGILKMEMEF